MRIALISQWLARESARFGSQGGFVQQTAEALRDRGHEVVALSQLKHFGEARSRRIGRIPTVIIDAEKRRANVRLLDKLAKGWTGHRKVVTDALRIRRFLREHGPFDAVWAQAEEPDGTACAVASWMGAMPPIAITVQAVRWAEDKPGMLRFTRQRQLGIGFSRATKIAANSPLCAQWLQREYGVPERKIGSYRVTLTRSFLAAAEAARTTTAATPSAPRLLFLGALNATKAPDVFLAAARSLAPKHPDWHFVVAGGETDSDRAFAARLATLRQDPALTGRVTFTGALSEAQVIEEISRASVVACPSRIDTLSRATVESLALGKPVVVAENVGARYFVERDNSGLVVRCEAASLAAGLEHVLANAHFTAHAQAHATGIAQEHSPEAAALSIEKLLRG